MTAVSEALLVQGIVLWLAAVPLAIQASETRKGRPWAIAATLSFALGAVSLIAAGWVVVIGL